MSKLIITLGDKVNPKIAKKVIERVLPDSVREIEIEE